MKQLPEEADAVALLGIFTFTDEQGHNVSYKEVLRWVLENSKLLDFTFWKDRISYGTLCTVLVSAYEQGWLAGKFARSILLEGKSPDKYPIQSTIKGQPVISFYRANKLKINIKSGILLPTKVLNKIKQD